MPVSNRERGLKFLKFLDKNGISVVGLTKKELKNVYDKRYKDHEMQTVPNYSHFKFYFVMRSLFWDEKLHLRDDIIHKGPPPPEYYNARPKHRFPNQQASSHLSKSSSRNKLRSRENKISVDQHITFSQKTTGEEECGSSFHFGRLDISEGASSKESNLESSQFIKQNGKTYECLPCKIKGIGIQDVQPHLRGRRHQLGLLTLKVNEKGKDLMQHNAIIDITAECDLKDGMYCLNVQQSEERTLKFFIKNISDVNLEMVRCELLRDMRMFTINIGNKNIEELGNMPITVFPAAKVKCGREKPRKMETPYKEKEKKMYAFRGSACTIELKARCKHLGNYHTSIGFHFRQNGQEFNTVKKIQAYCGNSVMDQVKPIGTYKRPPVVARKQAARNIIEGLPLPRLTGNELEKEIQLEQYQVPTFHRRITNRGLNPQNLTDKERVELSAFKKMLEVPLNEATYKNVLNVLLFFEELQMEVDIRQYNMESAPMTECPDNKKLLLLRVPGLAENRPSVLRGDWLYVRINDKGQSEDREYQGFIHQVRQNDVALGFSDKLKFVKGMKFDVRFVFNRLPLKLQHRACDLAIEESLGELLFPTQSTICTRGIYTQQALQFYNRDLESNEEQKTAIENIVSGISRPAPYIVFGPPGTGKTVTVVEAIMQIWKCHKDSHILACAPSNSASDLIAQRLRKWRIPKSNILRMNASSRAWNSVPDDIIDICNRKADEYFYPPKKKLGEFRVVVCTLVTAGRLVSANFESGHFTHIFVDESGHAVEPECIIPLAGILCIDKVLKSGKNGQVVLAGDPKQLGPIIRSKFAMHYGLGLYVRSTAKVIYGREKLRKKEKPDKSLLERLMTECEVYGRSFLHIDQQNRQPTYDNRVVTKLLRNYRSHPSILEVPNQTFYENELVCCADKMIRESLCSWEELPRSNFPLIFHGVVGKDEREKRSPSFFNAAEVAVVVEYVDKLLNMRGRVKVKQKDIGVISPYRKQVQKLQQVLRQKGWKDIMVGSVEEFQGQERLVIIVSTVRSNPDYLSLDVKFQLGFLKNPKRFNVTVTRAKALLIVTGNPFILAHDAHWGSFISFCQDKGGYRGVEFDGDEEGVMADIINRMKNIGLETGSGKSPEVELFDDNFDNNEEREWRADI